MNLKIKKFIAQNAPILAFLALFFIYFTFSLHICFNSEILYKYWDLLFDMDTNTSYATFIKVNADSCRSLVHPFLIIIVQPIISLLDTFMRSPRASVLAANCIIGSLSSILIYFSLINFTNKKLFSIITASIYCFSLSVIIFSIMPELYIYAGFFICLFIFYISILRKRNIPLSPLNYFTLGFLIVIGFGVNPPILIGNIILLIWFLYDINKNSKKNLLKDLIKILVIIIAFCYSFTFLQKIAYPQSTVFLNCQHLTLLSKKEWVNKTYDLKTANTVLRGLFVSNFYNLKMESNIRTSIDNKIQYHTINHSDYQKPIIYIPAILFLLTGLLFFIFNFKRYEQKSLILTLLLITFVNFIEDIKWWPSGSFLYTQNNFPYMIITIGLIYLKFPPKVSYTILSSFTIFEIIKNQKALQHIKETIALDNTINLSFSHWLLFSFITTSIFALIIFLYRKYNFNKIQKIPIEYYIMAYFVLMTVSAIFVRMFKGIV